MDRRSLLLLLALVLFSLSLHLIVVTYGNVLVSDEHHYVPEARSIIQDRQLLHPEHPSLAKLFIAGGILVFGDNPWGWRLLPVLFGTCALIFFYLICVEIAGKRTAFVASIVFVSENLIFMHLGLAMLDVFSFTFMLLSFLFYLRKRYVLSGVALALSGLCKITGFFGVLVIVGHWLLVRRKLASKRSVALLVITAAFAFVLMMPLADLLATGELMNPFGRIHEMVFAAKGLTTGTLTPDQLQYIRYPWDWILSPAGHTLLPDWHYLDQITPTIWILIIPSLAYMGYEWWSHRRKVAIFVLLWFGATYLTWVTLSLLFDRITYLYYFFPALSSVCVAVGFAAQRIWATAGRAGNRVTKWAPRIVILIYLLIHGFLFYIYSPLIGVLTPSLLPPGGG